MAEAGVSPLRIRGSLVEHLKRDPLGRVGLGIFILLGFVALAAPWAAPYTVQSQDLAHRFAPPSASHPLGLDELGRDTLSRLMAGARISLLLALLVVSLSASAGVLIGAWAGLQGGWTDNLVTRLIDVFLAFPSILLAISLVAVLGPGLDNLVFALCMIGWVGYARLARAQALRARNAEFVMAARAAGAGRGRLLLRHLLPNVAGPLIVQGTVGMAGVILSEAGLSFLGLGLPPPAPSWGSMLRSGSQHLFDAPHLTLYPGAAIMLAVLSFNFLGDSLRDWLDPRMRRGADPGPI